MGMQLVLSYKPLRNVTDILILIFIINHREDFIHHTLFDFSIVKCFV